MLLPSSAPASSAAAPHAADADSPARAERGVTFRAGLLCLALALFFGTIITKEGAGEAKAQR